MAAELSSAASRTSLDDAAATRVTIEPTVAADLAALTDQPLPGRIKALTVKCGDEVLGIGGLRFFADGTIGAFVEITERGRAFPVSLHRAGLRCMREADKAGYRRIVAQAQPGNPAAERWLERLGFERAADDSRIFVRQGGT